MHLTPSQSIQPKDVIRVNDLLLTVPLCGGAHWKARVNAEPVPQPILVTLSISHDLRRTALTDDLSYSINYSSLSSTLCRNITSKDPAASLEDLSKRILDLVFRSQTQPAIQEIHLKVVQIKAPVHCKAIGVNLVAKAGTDHIWSVDSVKHFYEDIDCHAIIGVNACEREEKQVVRLNIWIEDATIGLEQNGWLDHPKLIKRLYNSVNESSFLTLEALASYTALEVLRHYWDSSERGSQANVTIEAAKPSALVFASSAVVKIRRTFADFYPEFLSNREWNPDLVPDASVAPIVPTGSNNTANYPVKSLRARDQMSSKPEKIAHTAAIALGSNLGDRFHNIELALRLLEIPQNMLATVPVKDVNAESNQEMTVTVVDTSFLYQSSPMYVTDQPPFINCTCLIETNLQPLTLLRHVKNIEEAVGRVPSIRNGPRVVDLDILLYDDAVIDTRPATKRADLENLKGELVVPHPRMGERLFVLKPLNDIVPDHIHPLLQKTVHTLLAELELVSEEPPMEKVIPFPRYPLPEEYHWPHKSVPPVPPTLTYWTFAAGPLDVTPRHAIRSSHKTRLMATLNVTPDSFSDGSSHNTLHTALAYAREAVAAGASIIDVGGYSTRPGAAFVSVEEEMKRVVPVVRAIKQRPLVKEEREGEKGSIIYSAVEAEETHARLWNMPISVDTFRWDVARAAIIAGASCINDVYAFTGPDSYPYPPGENGKHVEDYMAQMKKVAREFAVPVVLMHSRGDAGRNKDYEKYGYARTAEGPGAVIEGIQVELGHKVDHIIKGKGGVRRWFAIIDPGIGFSKDLEGNLEVLRDAKQITASANVGPENRSQKRNPLLGYPMLIGASKKSFLGAILAQGESGRNAEPKDRSWATAAAVTCAVQQEAMVVRVHDVKEMGDVVQVANALWRS